LQNGAIFFKGEKMTFGEYLKESRIEKGLTQKQAAKLCGMPETQYQGYEQGRYTKPGFETMVKLAHGIGFSLDDCAQRIFAL
jgi:transcriptional regulator with XRE-family HTH domain